MNLKLGFIGSGSVAPYHLEVLSHLGIRVACIASKENSTSVTKIAHKHKIDKIEKNWANLIENNSDLNAIIICTPPTISSKIIDYTKKTDISVLVEKPGAFSSQELIAIRKTLKSKVFFAFNRRFYHSVNKFKDNMNRTAGFLVVKIIEDKKYIRNKYSVKEILVLNSTHYFDMINYLIGEFRIGSVNKLSGNFGFRTTIINSNNMEIGEIFIEFGTPANTSITFENSEISLKLEPIEKYTRANSLSVVEPTKKNPIRSYIPVWNQTIDKKDAVPESQFKPGFLEQMDEFIGTLNGTEKNANSKLAQIDSAIFALKIAENFAQKISKTI